MSIREPPRVLLADVDEERRARIQETLRNAGAFEGEVETTDPSELLDRIDMPGRDPQPTVVLLAVVDGSELAVLDQLETDHGGDRVVTLVLVDPEDDELVADVYERGANACMPLTEEGEETEERFRVAARFWFDTIRI